MCLDYFISFIEKPVVSLLLGVVIGGAITWFCSWYYYKQAGEELNTQSEQLKKLNIMMINGMEHAGWIKVTRDQAGNPIGFEQRIGVVGFESAAFGGPSVAPATAQKPPTQRVTGVSVNAPTATRGD